jgi:hypothetical protein
MPAPDIFYFPPLQQAWMETLFAIFGRALALATRFESGVYALSGLIKLRRDPAVLDSEDSLRAFADSLRKGPLAKVVRRLSEERRDSFVYVFNVLNDARKARNELVHEGTLGFEHWAEDEERAQDQIDHLRVIVWRLAMADRFVSGLSKLLSNEPMPTTTAFREYRRALENWVFSGWNEER